MKNNPLHICSDSALESFVLPAQTHMKINRKRLPDIRKKKILKKKILFMGLSIQPSPF